MPNQRERDRARIDGRATFAGAAYLMGIGLIFLLERVGAPDGLVRSLGPLFALTGLALLGVLTRSTRVPAFFAADRAVPAPYVGLGFAGIAAGLILCLDPASGSPLPLAGVALGLCISALVVGPTLRATDASGLSDLLATRFPNPLLRLYFAGLLFAIGALVAAAGFATAVDAFVALLAPSRSAAVIILAIILALMVVPGGLAGLLWSAAASAGILIVILALPIAAQTLASDAAIGSLLRDPGIWGDALTRAWGADAGGDPGAHLLVVLASALAIATLPSFASPTVGSSSVRQAVRGGALGVIFVILIGFGAFVDLVLWPISVGPMNGGLRSGAMLVAALTLAAAGLRSASRAWGTNAEAHQRYAPLASQRLARARALMLIVIAFCAALTTHGTFNPKLALLAAAALSLSLAAPALALACSARANSAHGAATAFVSLIAVLVLGAIEGRVPGTEKLLVGAICAGAAGFIAGWSAAIFSPDQRDADPVRRDLFLDAPLEAGD